VLVKDLETAQKALSAEQSARSVAELILQQSKDVNVAVSLKLDNVKTSLAITQDKLEQKSKALDSQTIRADEAELRVKSVEDKLKTIEADRDLDLLALILSAYSLRWRNSCSSPPPKHFFNRIVLLH
jgi:hypothetical protein